MNTVQVLGVPSDLSTVSEVRAATNRRRIIENYRLRSRDPRYGTDNPTLPQDGWFLNSDVDASLREQGLSVRSWASSSDSDRDNVEAHIAELEKQGIKFVIYTGNGRHYRGIYSGDEGQFLLDSLKPDLEAVGAANIRGMIDDTALSNRTEWISVASVPVETSES